MYIKSRIHILNIMYFTIWSFINFYPWIFFSYILSLSKIRLLLFTSFTENPLSLAFTKQLTWHLTPDRYSAQPEGKIFLKISNLASNFSDFSNNRSNRPSSFYKYFELTIAMLNFSYTNAFWSLMCFLDVPWRVKSFEHFV